MKENNVGVAVRIRSARRGYTVEYTDSLTGLTKLLPFFAYWYPGWAYPLTGKSVYTSDEFKTFEEAMKAAEIVYDYHVSKRVAEKQVSKNTVVWKFP